VETWSLTWPDGKTGKWKRLAEWAKALFSLKKEIRKFNPDILIGYRLTSYGFIAAYTGIRPLVIAAQGETDVWPPGHWSLPLKRFLARYAIRRADLIHTWAEHMAESVFELGGSKEKTLILSRGIDLNNFKPGPSKSFEQLTLIVSRALYPEYGHETIFRSVKAIADKHIPVKLYVAGEGILRAPLEQLAKELNIAGQVEFLGRVNNQTLTSYLRESNVYVSMPETDGVSASLLEAMACCCVPVVSDLPANRIWITHNQNGFLIPLGGSEALTDCLMHIYHRHAEMRALTEYNRRMVEEKGSQEKNTRIFLTHYQKLISKYN
jgi:glycosyltransferase involved in cell wall biosynthesis